MKKLFTALVFCLGLMGLTSCTESVAYAQPVVVNQPVQICDQYGCRYVVAPYYYNTPRVWVTYRRPYGGYYYNAPRYYYRSGVRYYYRGGYRGGWRR